MVAALHKSTLEESRGGADLGEYISRAAGGKKLHAFWLSLDGVLFLRCDAEIFPKASLSLACDKPMSGDF
jgi:hypothetical protein